MTQHPTETVKALSDDLFDTLYDKPNAQLAGVNRDIEGSSFCGPGRHEGAHCTIIAKAASDAIFVQEDDAVATQPIMSARRACDALAKAQTKPSPKE